MICNDNVCNCGIVSSTLTVTGSGSVGDPYHLDTNAFNIVTSLTHPAGFLGQHIYETDTGRVFAFDGANWIWQSGNPPRFQIEAQSLQSIADSSIVTPVLSTEVVDTDAFHASTNGFVTIPSTWGGDYIVMAQTRWAVSAASYRYLAAVIGNNTGVTQTGAAVTGGSAMIGTGNNGYNASGMFRMRATATATINVLQATGGALDLNTCSLKGVLINHIPTLV